MAHLEPHNEHGNQGVEPEGLQAGMVFKVTLGISVLMVIFILAGYQIAQRAFREAKYTTTEITGYPLLRTTTEQGLQAISEYAPVTGAEGRYRIPIDRAIDLMVNEAAAARAAGSASPAVR